MLHLCMAWGIISNEYTECKMNSKLNFMLCAEYSIWETFWSLAASFANERLYLWINISKFRILNIVTGCTQQNYGVHLFFEFTFTIVFSILKLKRGGAYFPPYGRNNIKINSWLTTELTVDNFSDLPLLISSVHRVKIDCICCSF